LVDPDNAVEVTDAALEALADLGSYHEFKQISGFAAALKIGKAVASAMNSNLKKK